MILAQNLSKLYGLIWGQFTPPLKEDSISLSEYKAKFSKYDCVLLLQHLKASSLGANKVQYIYMSYIFSLKSLVIYRQQDHESTEAIYERLVSALQNFKLVGDDLNPNTITTKAQDNNFQLCKK